MRKRIKFANKEENILGRKKSTKEKKKYGGGVGEKIRPIYIST
jgi:hypothetical protein